MEQEKLIEEVSETLNEMYADGDEELRELSQEQKDIELFLTKTFPEVLASLDAFKKDPSKDNLHKLESSMDVIRTQYHRIDQVGLTAEHLTSTLAKLIDRLDSFLKELEETNGQDSSSKPLSNPNVVPG